MNYKQTLNYLYSKLPMYQRIGAAAYKPNLNNTIALCKLLGNPERKIKTIHVAGTNGKGSTSHIIASTLQKAGHKVGLYTSPHLLDFRERIKINGKLISKKYVVDFVEKYKNEFERIELSFFEMTVGLAFDYFVNQKVDVAIIEVGLGGRLDSTNVIKPLVSVITNISYDHMNLLGNTLPKIAAEKAGIIKPKTPVIIGELQPEVKKVFLSKAKQLKSMLLFADQSFEIRNVKSEIIQSKKMLTGNLHYKNGGQFIQHIQCELPASYQVKNIITAYTTILVLKNVCDFNVSDNDFFNAVKNVKTLTGLNGRWQTICNKPLTIADVGHNESGIKEVVKMISQTNYNKLHFVLGVVNDKDISKILQLLPKQARYYFCQAKIPRALNVLSLAQQAKKIGLKGGIYLSVKDAVKAAQLNAAKNDLIFIGGSTFTVADALE